jgi:hypothetical protein
MKSHGFGVALLSVIVIVASASAHAQGTLTRTFVSSTGVDSNPCTIAQPCASFAAAYRAVAADGIVAALDPGKYGPLNILYPVTINGNGWAAITGTPNGAGITVNTFSGHTNLIGIEIDGANASFNGILFTSGSLTVTNCVIGKSDYVNDATTGNGILIEPVDGIPALDIAITNSTISNNGNMGIYYFPQGGNLNFNATIDHVVVMNNAEHGIEIYSGNTSGGATVAAISDSIVSHNTNDGIVVGNGPGTLWLSIDHVEINNNGQIGILANNNSKVLLGRSVITGNGPSTGDFGSGIQNQTTNTFYSYGDNRINLNGNGAGGEEDINGALNTSFTTH